MVMWLRCDGLRVEDADAILANTKRWINVGLTLFQYRTLWTNNKTTFIQRFVSAGMDLQ